MDLAKINYARKMTEVSANKIEKEEQNVILADNKETKSTKLQGFAEVGYAVAGIMMNAKKIINLPGEIKNEVKNMINEKNNMKDELLGKLLDPDDSWDILGMNNYYKDFTKNVHKLFKNQPDVLAKIHTTPDKDGFCLCIMPVGNKCMKYIEH